MILKSFKVFGKKSRAPSIYGRTFGTSIYYSSIKQCKFSLIIYEVEKTNIFNEKTTNLNIFFIIIILYSKIMCHQRP